jgi:hypothetical protein
MRGRVVLGAMSAVVALGGLSGCAVLGLGPTPATSGAPASSKAPGSPKALPVLSGITTPKPKTAAPGLATTGAAWLPILTSLSGYGQWLLANPDPALIANIATPGCPMSDLIGPQLAALLRENAYVRTSPVAFTTAIGPSPVAGTRITLTITASRVAEPVLSRTTNIVITTYAPLPPTNVVVTLDKGTDGRWRLCTANPQGDSGDAGDPSVPLL